MNHEVATPLAPSNAARAAAFAGLLWSLFGVFQFASQTFTNADGLVASGMTPAQAALYTGLPPWMDGVFAIGTIGGVLGCLALLLARRIAVPVLCVSLAAYLALFAGDAAYGVFAAFGTSQVAILSSVVLIAAGLLWLAQRLNRQGVLS
jgi:hypothetical protein